VAIHVDQNKMAILIQYFPSLPFFIKLVLSTIMFPTLTSGRQCHDHTVTISVYHH
jgi:hypothetical protein